PSTGLTASVNPALVTGGSGTSKLTVSPTAPGTYTVTVTGQSPPTLSHSTTVTVNVPKPDFSLSASPSTLSVNEGATGMSTVTVSPQGGFAGEVALTTSVSPSTGLTASVNPALVTGGSGTSTL